MQIEIMQTIQYFSVIYFLSFFFFPGIDGIISSTFDLGKIKESRIGLVSFFTINSFYDNDILSSEIHFEIILHFEINVD